MISRTARRRVKKFLLWMEVIFILVLGAGVGVAAGAYYQISRVLPQGKYLEQYRTPVGTTIWSADGVRLATLSTENREPVTIDRIPKVMRDAIIDIEDSRFYQHSGVDLRGIVRALWLNLRGGDLRGQGGSTLTQQLAREVYLTKSKTLSRKIKEALLAIQIERSWTKEQILETYLNQYYFGSGAYGIQSAAKVYFNKDVKDLKVPEAAMIAGLAQRPSYLSPYVTMERDGNYDATILRRNQVIQRMADLGHITPDEAREAQHAPLKLAYKKAPQLGGYYRAKHFVDFVVRNLRETYGDDMLFKGGLNVRTTLNWKVQKEAEKAARNGIAHYGGMARASECAIVAIEPQTGFVKAMVGGVQEPWEKYQFNCAAQAKRSPGSSFKTFVYATALERGWNPYRAISLYVKPIKDGNKVWAPKNHGGASGSQSLVTAFANSTNSAAVNLGMQVGLSNVVEMARRMGIQSKLLPVPSLPLGTSEVTVLEMAAAYATIANGGHKVEPQWVLKITNQDKNLIESNAPRMTREVLSPSTVDGMKKLMRAVITSGTGRAAAGVPNSFGKTGTAEEHRDAWFVGFTPELSTAVWVGNRDNSKMRYGVYGGKISTPIWADFMNDAVKVLKKLPGKKGEAQVDKSKPDEKKEKVADAEQKPAESDDDFEAITVISGSRENSLRVKVCKESGDLATRWCPEYETHEYLSGQQPESRCTLHQPPPEEKPQRLRRASEREIRSAARATGDDTPRRRRRTRRTTPRSTAPAPDTSTPPAGDGGAAPEPDTGTDN